MRRPALCSGWVRSTASRAATRTRASSTSAATRSGRRSATASGSPRRRTTWRSSAGCRVISRSRSRPAHGRWRSFTASAVRRTSRSRWSTWAPVRCTSGDTEIAQQRLDKALEIARRLGFTEGVAWSMHELAVLARRQHRHSREQHLMLRDVLLVHQQLGDRWRTASVLEEIAGAILVSRDPTLAVNLLACAQALRDRIGTPISLAEAPDREQALSQLKQRLNADAFEAAWSRWPRARPVGGDRHGGSRDRATRLRPAGRIRRRAPPILTPRELAVLKLLQQGMTNREIGASLYISPSTAGVHVANIVRKLGVTSAPTSRPARERSASCRRQ